MALHFGAAGVVFTRGEATGRKGQEATMKATLKKFFHDESGATAIEYGLIAALVSVAAILALQAMGASLDTMFNSVATILSGAVAGP